MRLLRHIVRHSLVNYIFAIALFAFCWHVFSTYSELNNRMSFFKTQIRTDSRPIEALIRENNEFAIIKMLNSYISDVLPTIHFKSQINKQYFNEKVVAGNLKFKNGLSFNFPELLVNDGLVLGDIIVYYDLLQLNRVVFSKNLILYICIAMLFLTFMSLANYNSYRFFTSLEESIHDLEKNINVQDLSSTINHLKLSITSKSNSQTSLELARLLEKIKTLLDKQLELHDSSRRNEIISKLSRQVAHDIRSPLSLLKICSKTPERLAQNSDIIEAVVCRMEAIAENLLDKTRSNEAVPSSAAEEECLPQEEFSLLQGFNIQTAVKQVFNEKVLEHSSSGVMFNLSVKSTQSMLMYGNMQEFKTIISNLINNSVESFKVQQQDKCIHLVMRESTRGAEVNITDNGCGMSDEHVRDLEIHAVSKGKVNGNGLGLKMAFSRIKSWGGIIKFNSTLQQGTRVSLYFQRIPSLQQDPFCNDAEPSKVVS